MRRLTSLFACACLAPASLASFYGCSGDDNPADVPTDMSEDSVDGGDGDGDLNPEPAGVAQGDPCSPNGAVCAAGLTCVENVCCDEACDGLCQSCRGDISGGFDGECTLLEAGDEVVIEEEGYEDCPGVQTCDGEGACFARVVGERCESDGQCASGFCTDGMCCDSRCSGTCENCATGACTVVENAPDPGTCESECFEGGICDGKAVGETCTGDGECGSRLCSDSDVCVVADGEVCDDDAQCLNVCVDGKCQPASMANESCEADPDCVSGLACVSGQCLGLDGTNCETNGECISVCISSNCAPPAGPGMGCDGSETADCQSPSSCIDAVCRLPDGASCSSPGVCATRCVNGSCGLSDVGESCETANDCVSGLVCSSDGKCSFPTEVRIDLRLTHTSDVMTNGFLSITCSDAAGIVRSAQLQVLPRGTQTGFITCARNRFLDGVCGGLSENRVNADEVGDFELVDQNNNDTEFRVLVQSAGLLRCNTDND